LRPPVETAIQSGHSEYRIMPRRDQILDTVWQSVLAAAKRTEEELGQDAIGALG
jgi:hypothetical protein